MAAVFQRPVSILDDPQDNQIRPQRRRRDSIEVIDVDELDDDIYHTHPGPESSASRPAQRRRLSMPSEIISLLDSDEEDLVISASNVRPGENFFSSDFLTKPHTPYDNLPVIYGS